MASPFVPSAGRGHRGGAPGVQSSGRGRGASTGNSTYVARGSGAPRAGRARGRGRGSATWTARGRGRGAGAANYPTNGTHQPTEASGPAVVNSPFAQLNQQKSAPSPFGAQPAQASPFSRVQNGLSSSNVAKNPFAQPTANMNQQPPAKIIGGGSHAVASMDNASMMGSYQERFDRLKIDQVKQRERAIKDGQMADPNQPTSLNQAITPVGTCTSMCPEFERVERIVQKAVDKCEKHLDPSTNQLQIMETKMVKRFRRAAAGNDEQLPSDIRTPKTLLQTMNYLIRHVINGGEPLAAVHMFVWNRTRSIRNDFSVQQLTHEEDVKTAVTCLERIARFHIVSLHLLSSPTNTESFDRHQEREQLNNTMLSLMYYYDDNRDRIHFPNEDEFRAYHILFSIHDQRPDLEARVSKWPTSLLTSPRVRVALELFAAACNTWEPQGALDARRPNAIAQGFYARFFNIINSPSVSYLMACVAEVYFNHIRQTAIRAIWKAYCRTPLSQQSKNDHWTVEELTKVLHMDNDEQTIEYCNAQSLQFTKNASGVLYLNWGDRPVDSIDFAPSSEHAFSDTYVESKRAGRSLVAIILGMNIREAARMGMIDRTQLPQKREQTDAADGDLFVSDADNGTPAPVVETKNIFPPDTSASEFRNAFESQKSFQPTPAVSPSLTTPNFPSPALQPSNPFAALQSSKISPLASPQNPPSTFPPSTNPFAASVTSSSVAPVAPSPFAPAANPFMFPKGTESGNKAEAPAATANVIPSPFQTSFPPSKSDTETPKPPFSFTSPPGPSPSEFASASSTLFPKPAATGLQTQTPAASPPALSKPSVFPSVPSTSDQPTSILASGSTSSTAPSPFSFSKPTEIAQKAETLPGTTPAASTLFKPITSPVASTANKPAFVFAPGSSPFPASSSFSFSKPAETIQKTETTTTTPETSTLFKPSTLSSVTSTSDKEASVFAPAPSSFSFSKPVDSKTETPQPAPAPSALTNPFAFPSGPLSSSSSALGLNTATAASSPFTGFKAPETIVKAKEPAVVSAPEQTPSFFQTKNADVIPSSKFASPEVVKPSQKADIPASAPSPLEKPSSIISAPLSSLAPTKPSETPTFSVSAPTTAQLPSTKSAPLPVSGPASVSRASFAAASPPRTLFEALKRPKIFDTTSDTYSHELTASQPPKALFPTTDSPVEPGHTWPKKRHHEVTDEDTTHQQKRRSSLKGSSSFTSSDGSFKRSVRFEDNHEAIQSLPNDSQVQKKKRDLEELAEPQSGEQGPSAKLSKIPTADEHVPFNFSVYKAENRPMPKLPILEKLEEKLARAKALCEPKPLTPEQLQYIEEARLKRSRQVDEDEIALSRARILAEKLRTGPGIFDGWTGPIRQPWHDPNWNPAARILEKYHARNIPPPARYPVPPRLTLNRTARGYEVAYAPDTPDRPMSRTEQRIRRTGARGLAHVPLNFERYKRERKERAKERTQAESENKENKENGDAGKNPEEERNGFTRSV
ncbi:SAC3/GANP/Nin1/mts3/eIF-3 p25 [Penicillium paradoxum]|uniref:SAC3/GANP/Nin1/mts3/eIF-3 p25 n=1 Tax=Penicillium paradoxum TaxID=176176 RepID=UPI002546DAC4|nr:SAC3/GANP/Nin1/mts3/eIF-3 p25 [Penicillium paradoxum]KAJ5794841.1 SAC3/GANP/Nin1/mts3/eIF-3 p25 [Penicillium paradoxum]